jgi:NifB/MoaA-like Fe-S oxidoreductase
VACGELIAPTMRAAVERFNARTGAVLDTVAIENVYLGPEINVSGLLSGQDLLATFARRPTTEPLYISDRMVSQRTGTLLDDMTIEEIETTLGRPVVPAADLSDVARDLRTRARRQALVAA